MTLNRSLYRYALIAGCSTLGAISAPASIIAEHVGCADPTAEGWTVVGSGVGVTAEPACGAGGADSAWRFDDASSIGSLAYRTAFSSERLALLASRGWSLRAELAINTSAGGNTPFDTTHGLNYRTDTRGYDLFMRLLDPNTVRVYAVTQYDIGPGASGLSADVSIQAGQRFLIEMNYNPATQTADIAVNGNDVINGYGGAALIPIVCCQRGVSWGATTASGTGEALWRSVQFELNCALPAGDVTGNGTVDLTDLATLLSSFGLSSGQPGYVATADFDNDNSVTLTDLATLLSNFGSSCQ